MDTHSKGLEKIGATLLVVALSTIWSVAQEVGSIPIHRLATGQPFPNIVKLTNTVVDEARGKAYFAGSLSRHIGVINTHTLQMTDAIDTGVRGFTFKLLRVNPATGIVYMFVLETGKLYRIDPLSHMVSLPITVQRAPVIDRFTHRLYITEMPDKIRIYNETLQLIDTMSGVTDPGELFIDAPSNRLYVLHSVPPPWAGVSVYNLSTKAFIRRYSMPPGFAGVPRAIHVADGKIYVASSATPLDHHSLSIIDIASGAGAFVILSVPGGQMTVHNGVIYQMTGYPFVAGYLPEADGAYGVMELRNAVSGAKFDEQWIDFDAQYFDLDRSQNRLYYAGTGSGMMGVRNLTDFSVVSQIDVTTTIEDVLIHPNDGSLYLRNRLGGSTLYRVDPASQSIINTLRPGNWPTKILLDASRNRLYALSHYESKISVFDLATDAEILEIPLQTQRARTDSLSTMTANFTTGVLYVAIPELGTLTRVNADGTGAPQTISIAGFDPMTARGPGKLHLAVNEVLNYLYVFIKDAKRLNIYDGSSLVLRGFTTLAEFNQWESPLDLLYSDDGGNRVFVGALIVDAQTGALMGQISQGLKVIGVSPDRSRYYVLERIAPGFTERVYEYDASLQTAVRQWDFSPVNGVFSAFALDFTHERLYVGYFERGEVAVARIGLPGDVNHDGCVDDLDLLSILFVFGGVHLDADMNCDGIVDDADLLQTLLHFGTGC